MQRNVGIELPKRLNNVVVGFAHSNRAGLTSCPGRQEDREKRRHAVDLEIQHSFAPSGTRTAVFALFLLLCLPLRTPAQTVPASTSQETPAPGPGSVISVLRTSTPVQVDGVLDDAIWQKSEVATGFRQRWPMDGAPASERTEVRVAYDNQAIYFGLIMHDAEPERILGSILDRDGRLDQPRR